MEKIRIDLKNCYGIKDLNTEFDFSIGTSVAIYAPNGAMKSSFAQTFADIANGAPSKDRIFPKKATSRNITDEKNTAIKQACVVVLRPYDEVFGDAEKVSTLLVDRTVDFTNFCPIRQQLMSNFLCAMRFRPLPGHRSTASADILAAIPPDAVPTTDDSPEQRLQEGRIVDLAGLVRMNGPMRPYDTSPTARALSKARLRVPSDS